LDRIYEIRDPVHGFIKINEWEREIVNHPVFQRLRRIRQLGLTDMVYPGAMHTRFEHSLGMMHVATRMYEEIVQRRSDFLESELKFNSAGLGRDKTLVRISCLLHDIGHCPFSHSGEGLMPSLPNEKDPYKHENYSAAVVRYLLKDVIENHPLNQNYRIKANEVADFLEGKSSLGRSLLWRDLLSGQIDADRADYLLRDSHHIGVEYGKYDLNRLLVTLTVAIDPETESPTLAVEEGGMHAAEGLILARYMMFTQVYFQHTRRAYDVHLALSMKELLAEEQRKKDPRERGFFPPPTDSKNIRKYLGWTDWRVWGILNEGGGGDHGKIIEERRHHRKVFETREVPEESDFEFLEAIWSKIGNGGAFIDKSESVWYKSGPGDIPIVRSDGEFTSLSKFSNVVRNLKAISQTRIYVPYEKRNEALSIVESLKKGA